MTEQTDNKLAVIDRQFQKQLEPLQDAQKILQELENKIQIVSDEMFKMYSTTRYELLENEK